MQKWEKVEPKWNQNVQKWEKVEPKWNQNVQKKSRNLHKPLFSHEGVKIWRVILAAANSAAVLQILKWLPT